MMKKNIQLLVLLFVQFSFAQLDYVIKFSAESWGVTKDVVKIEEAVYFAADNPKAYSTAVYTFQNGKLQNLVYKTTDLVDVYKFEYNTKGNPIKYTSTVNDNKPRYSSFIYDKKGRLIEIMPEESSDFLYKYQYDSSGKLSSIEQYSNNKLSNKQVITSYKDDKNYNFIAEMYSSSDGKKISESNRQFVNGMEVKSKDLLVFGTDVFGSILLMRQKDFLHRTYAFYSRKITYKDGKVTGSTDYNPYFTEGINADISDLPENKNPKSSYKIRLGEDGKFKMENQANQPIPDLSKGFISPNKTDFIYFDPNNGEVALVENMKPSEEFVAMKPYNVPSKRYIVINNDYQFIIFDNGKQIDTSSMKLAQDMGNLVIQENGVPKYFVPNLDKLTFLKFYPLYILAL
jgi:hypothetical protein